MNIVNESLQNRSAETITLKDFEPIANELCEQALNQAKDRVHPLIRNLELDRLGQRHEFVMAFRPALESRIARLLAARQLGIEAVFKFDVSRMVTDLLWDGTVHLLVKVPRLSDAIRTFGNNLDQSLLLHLRQSGWSRFRKSQSVLEIQQVTRDELRHAVSYGAMFCAVYNVPIKVWPQNS